MVGDSSQSRIFPGDFDELCFALIWLSWPADCALSVKNQSVSQSVSQSDSQSVSQSISHQSVSQPVKQSISQSRCDLCNDTTDEPRSRQTGIEITSPVIFTVWCCTELLHALQLGYFHRAHKTTRLVHPIVQGNSVFSGMAQETCDVAGSSPLDSVRAQEQCESRGGRPGLPVPNSPYGFCGRKAQH